MSTTFMVAVFAFLTALPAQIVYGQNQANYVGNESCLKCHPIKGDKKETTISKWKNHKHAKLEHGCETCHGPGKEHSSLKVKQLLDLKKKKGDLKIKLKSLRKSEACAHCHQKTKDKSIALHSDFLVSGQQQYTEMLYNKKTQLKMTCVMCHDAHASSSTKEGIKRKCLDCHKGKYKVEVKIAAMSGLSCEDCHMPYAGVNKKDTMVEEYHKGDVRSHIFGISVDPKYALNDGTGKAKLDKNGFARLTVEQTCYACHITGKAHDMNRKEMLARAKKIH